MIVTNSPLNKWNIRRNLWQYTWRYDFSTFLPRHTRVHKFFTISFFKISTKEKFVSFKYAYFKQNTSVFIEWRNVSKYSKKWWFLIHPWRNETYEEIYNITQGDKIFQRFYRVILVHILFLPSHFWKFLRRKNIFCLNVHISNSTYSEFLILGYLFSGSWQFQWRLALKWSRKWRIQAAKYPSGQVFILHIYFIIFPSSIHYPQSYNWASDNHN